VEGRRIALCHHEDQWHALTVQPRNEMPLILAGHDRMRRGVAAARRTAHSQRVTKSGNTK
jgi:hypothetical protein